MAFVDDLGALLCRSTLASSIWTIRESICVHNDGPTRVADKLFGLIGLKNPCSSRKNPVDECDPSFYATTTLRRLHNEAMPSGTTSDFWLDTHPTTRHFFAADGRRLTKGRCNSCINRVCVSLCATASSGKPYRALSNTANRLLACLPAVFQTQTAKL